MSPKQLWRALFEIAILNTLKPMQNGHNFADGIFNCFFWMNDSAFILVKISRKFVPTSVQIPAWRTGDTSCIAWPRWFDSNRPLFYLPYSFPLSRHIYFTTANGNGHSRFMSPALTQHRRVRVEIIHIQLIMMTSSNGNTFSVIGHLCGEFTGPPHKGQLDVFFDLRLNTQLSKQSWGWWFDAPSRPLWRHNDVL